LPLFIDTEETDYNNKVINCKNPFVVIPLVSILFKVTENLFETGETYFGTA
jgi:hypothetical protein